MQIQNLKIPFENIFLNGILQIPLQSNGIVLFVHGSGSGRLSKRNQYVADLLNAANFATLLFDLLTEAEESVDEITSEHRFNIPLLTDRLIGASRWVTQQSQLKKFPIGYFGASTGAAAALRATAQQEELIKAVVSRGGRPDLAGDRLVQVKAPTLLIVGSMDEPVIELNKSALQQMQCVADLQIVLGATHLFEEAGTLDQVAALAIAWFKKYLH